jgi:hypothetical protein
LELQKAARDKPIHDSPIRGEALLAKEESLTHFDLYKMTVEDLNVVFDRELEFTVEKDAELNAFVVWFDVGFPNGIILSTSPHLEPTHWNQEILVLSEAIPVCKGDRVNISFRLERNRYWKRHFIFYLEGTVNETSFAKVFPHHRLQLKGEDDSQDEVADEDEDDDEDDENSQK